MPWLCTRLMGESPRWLIVRGHHEQALRVLHKAARWNRVKLPEDRELRALIKDIQEESMTPPAMGTEGTTKKWYQRAVPSLLRTRPIQIITVVVCIDYFSVSLVFDGLNMNGDSYTSDPFLYLVLSGLAEIPAYVLAAPVIDRWGRRLPTVLIFVLCGVIITTVAFIPPELHALMMVLALTGKLCISAIFQILYLYASELFPTEVRMQGIGAATVFSQLASTLVPFITTFLGPVLPWLPSLIFGIVAAVAGVVTLALRESKGVPLPDTLADLNKTTASATSATTTSATTTTCATIATTTTRATIATITISEKDVDK
ncbi:Solute carrier family 22 member 5 [Chionoecetes opilio]|uniref:Solute carrier family 22 member 5 n=1 Tax=Chionoecetes opilio TaxID=41210 RepID=A0A8J5CM93_CHIOP|nr:Solute carrier family 22 member 5 [Chionoecetes opilio]